MNALAFATLVFNGINAVELVIDNEEWAVDLELAEKKLCDTNGSYCISIKSHSQYTVENPYLELAEDYSVDQPDL